MNSMISRRIASFSSLFAILLLVLAVPVPVRSDLRLREIHPGNFDVAYQREPSTGLREKDREISSRDPYFKTDIKERPIHHGGIPGVVMFDANGDGHEDIYVTNGPGVANGLYINDGGRDPHFTQESVSRGADISSVDCTCVCVGDIDNDGDRDIYVGGRTVPDILLLNDGPGHFTDVSVSFGISAVTDGFSPAGCSFGDLNVDGYLDLFVGNTFNGTNQFPIFLEDPSPFNSREKNILFINDGSGTGFTNEIDNSGDIALVNQTTWAVAIVDHNGDGYPDIWTHNDQAAVRTGIVGRLLVYENDGTGHFTDVSDRIGFSCEREINDPNVPDASCFYAAALMAPAFGDWDCNGKLDHFMSNLGKHTQTYAIFGEAKFNPDGNLPPGMPLERNPAAFGTSRWFFQGADGKFADSIDVTTAGTSEFPLGGTPFGWGAGSTDMDNDGSFDIVYHGGLDNFGDWSDWSNPGAILLNDPKCTGKFRRSVSMQSTTNHTFRSVRGLSVGDLNGDGFPDVVTASSLNMDPSTPLSKYIPLDSPFDDVAIYARTHMVHPTLPYNDTFKPLLKDPAVPDWLPGDLSVEISNADSQNNWIKVKLMGMKGLTTGGSVNRDGIGATISVTPKRGGGGGGDDDDPSCDFPTSMSPVMGGSSHASQHSSTKSFGLSRMNKADVVVQWPGGTWNALDNVRKNRLLEFPEIPCSFKDKTQTLAQFEACVINALDDLRGLDILDSLDREQSEQFERSMRRAFVDFSSLGQTV